jgi:flavin-dependent dehydrogenase
MRRTSALIVGGGPAGSAAAIMLGRAGVRAELIEKTSGPHDVVCGGFLGWDALGALECLGVDPWALGARPIDLVRLVSSHRTVEARLPRRAAGLSRRMLDEALINAAAQAGALVTRGVAAKAVEAARSVRLSSGEVVSGDALLLATGKHELRGMARPRQRDGAGSVVGLRANLPSSTRLRQELEGVIELHLFDSGYAGLLLQEDGTANLCLSIGRERLNRAGGVDGLMAELSTQLPRLATHLHDAANAKWESIAGVPYGWRAQKTEPGSFRLGDQGAVIASLAGDGVAIALTSGMEAAAALIREGPGGAQGFQKHFARRAGRPLRIASALRAAAENGRSRDTLMFVLSLAPALVSTGARLTRIRA